MFKNRLWHIYIYPSPSQPIPTFLYWCQASLPIFSSNVSVLNASHFYALVFGTKFCSFQGGRLHWIAAFITYFKNGMVWILLPQSCQVSVLECWAQTTFLWNHRGGTARNSAIGDDYLNISNLPKKYHAFLHIGIVYMVWCQRLALLSLISLVESCLIIKLPLGLPLSKTGLDFAYSAIHWDLSPASLERCHKF